VTISILWNDNWTAAIVNHLWQSTVVVGIAWLLIFTLRNNHARVRYWVWMAASVKFLLPFSLLLAAGEWIRSLMPAQVDAQPAVADVMEQFTQPFADNGFFNTAPSSGLVHRTNWLAIALVAAWVCGALVVAIRFARGWWRVYAAKRAARPLELAVEVPVLASPAKIEPGTFGIARPVLLLPEGILERLTPEQIEAILAHEMAHVRRRDNLTYTIHMLVEALYWFHPAVWWIGARLIEERERACDEAVAQTGSVAQIYAESILNVCKFCVESPLACVAGVTGANLKTRIVRIMTKQFGRKLNLSRKVLLATVGSMAVAAPVVVGLIHARQSDAQSVQPRVVPQVFDVASVRPNQTGGESRRAGASLGGLFTATNVPLKLLIARAYGVPESQIQGAPGWVDMQTYDISAKADTPIQMSSDELMPCLQALLADRFGLTVHRETKTGSVYSLEIAKNGPKIREDPESGTPAISASSSSRTVDLSGTRVAMARLAEYLSEWAGRPVINNTGLSGNYDFRVAWATEDAPDSAGPSLFSALEEQLGLKLIAAKGPLETIVIDHVERPSPN
jgi:bla regulator protein blaR1